MPIFVIEQKIDSKDASKVLGMDVAATAADYSPVFVRLDVFRPLVLVVEHVADMPLQRPADLPLSVFHVATEAYGALLVVRREPSDSHSIGSDLLQKSVIESV